MRGAWQSCGFRQGEVGWQEYFKVLGAWRRGMPARKSLTKFRLATREVRQAGLDV